MAAKDGFQTTMRASHERVQFRVMCQSRAYCRPGFGCVAFLRVPSANSASSGVKKKQRLRLFGTRCVYGLVPRAQRGLPCRHCSVDKPRTETQSCNPTRYWPPSVHRVTSILEKMIRAGYGRPIRWHFDWLCFESNEIERSSFLGRST